MNKILNKRTKSESTETGSIFFLKLVMFMIIGSQWLRIESFPDWSIPIPVGLILGLWFANHEHFKIDQKIEYAVLLICAFVSFWLPMGFYIQIT